MDWRCLCHFITCVPVWGGWWGLSVGGRSHLCDLQCTECPATATNPNKKHLSPIPSLQLHSHLEGLYVCKPDDRGGPGRSRASG